MSWKRLMAGVCASAVLIAGCGDDSADSGSGGAGGSDEKITGNKVIDPGSMDSAKGNVAFCTGKDTPGSKTAGVKAFNKANPGVTVKLIEFPESADEQRNQFVQRQEAKAADCDVFYSDVIWTAEFAQQKWLYDMTPYMTHPERQSEDIVKFSDASPLKAVYEDPAVKKAQPFSDELKSAVEQAKSRPVSPVYSQVSSAIYKNVNKALSGNVSPEEALKQAQSDMDKALKTF